MRLWVNLDEALVKKFHIFLFALISFSLSTPAYAANWGRLQKGACVAETGKRAYFAKLKRNFGDESAISLCPRLHKTVNGQSRVPDKCEKKGLTGYTGIWLVPDKTCTKKAASKDFTPLPVGKTS